MRLAVAALLSATAATGCQDCNQGPLAPPPSTAETETAAPAPEEKIPRACRPHCRISGLCHYDGKVCLAQSDADCKQAHACRVNGMCTAERGRCVGTSDADCKASERCTNEGLCHLRPGRGATTCMAKSEADCAQSAYCKLHGACQLEVDHCIIPGNEKIEPAIPPPP